jgi:uncharacterized protein (TIGR02271 family)
MTDNIEYDTRQLVGRTAFDPSDTKVGTISDVYVADESGQPEWLAVNTGLFGTKVSFVPLAGANAHGDDVIVAYDKDLIKDAPKADADGHLSPQEEEALYTHYGAAGTGAGFGDRRRGEERPDTGHDTSGSDEAMTRAEEELDVQKRTKEAGRARLRKWIDTEDVNIRVPVRRERARLVTEPITDANVDQAMSGDDLTTGEHEVVLSEEVVDVDKRVVPKERVRLETEAETDEVAVDETVRKERIELEDDADARRPRR